MVRVEEAQASGPGIDLLKSERGSLREEPELIVVDIEEKRSVACLLGQNAQLHGGKPGLGYIQQVALHLPRDIFHAPEVPRKAHPLECLYRHPAART